MSTRSWVVVAGLAVLLFARPSLAQVVLLEFKGDARNRLHLQLERALLAERLKVVSLRKYKAEAARKRVKGARTGNPAAVAAMSRTMGLTAVVRGNVAGRFYFTIMNDSGRTASSGSYAVSRGQLSREDARRFGSTVADISRGPPPPPRAPATPPPEPSPSVSIAPASQPQIGTESPTSGQTLPELDLSQSRPQDRKKRSEEASESAVAVEAGEVERKVEARPREGRIGPSLITVQLAGLASWRSYCSRPGVSSCTPYDSQNTVDFKPGSPYPGLGVAVDLFPLASFQSALSGIGLSASYGRGFSKTTVTVVGSPNSSQLSSSDDAFSVLAAYRYYFPLAILREQLPAYVGLHAGLMLHNFNVDTAPTLGSHRQFPLGGVDASVPFFKFLRFEAAFNYYLSPKAGSDELARYGSSVSSNGLGFEAGFAGEIWAPVGYVARFKYARVTDQFSGAGSTWQAGGTAQESYTGLTWGVTASF